MGAIVFDLDGTLVDSAPDIMAVANAVLAGAGAEPITLAQTRSFIGNGAPVFVDRMMAARGLPAAGRPALLADFLHRYDGQNDHVALFPGVLDALDALAAAGHGLGLCTNKPINATQSLLRHLGLDHRFATVIGGDSLPQHKPDPAPLLAAFAPLGAALIYVGDSEVDHATALAAGVPFALFSGGYRKTEVTDFAGARVFDHWSDLPALVAAL
jgi:phosphoglycolate phosphatase